MSSPGKVLVWKSRCVLPKHKGPVLFVPLVPQSHLSRSEPLSCPQQEVPPWRQWRAQGLPGSSPAGRAGPSQVLQTHHPGRAWGGEGGWRKSSLLPLLTPSATETSTRSPLPWAGALHSQEDLEMQPRARHPWTLCGVLYDSEPQV